VAGEASAFFGGHFADDTSWERVRRVARPLHPVLASALEAQNAVYDASPAREASLQLLRKGAAAVVTGQQVGLFLGPLYTVYKAASAIRLARSLSDWWGAPVVPVFWLQTEDHDAAEIAVCHAGHTSDGPLTVSLEVSSDTVSVAHRVLPEAVTTHLERLREALSPLPHGEEHVAYLERHYRPGVGWGAAFANVLAGLFANEGLVLIDPRDPALAPLAGPVHRRALTEAGPIARALMARGAELESAEFRAGVHVRDDAPLSFFHPDGPDGRRVRLMAADGGFFEVGTRRAHSPGELLATLDSDPAAFSTSALLRPILQDLWLPTVAYVGGPGEIAYFAQMAPLYAAFNVSMPVIVPRAQFRVLGANVRRSLTRRSLTAAAACGPFDEVLALARPGEPRETGGDRIAARLVEGVDTLLAEAWLAMLEAGERGERAIAKTRASMTRSAAKLGRSVDRARSLQDREIVEDIRRIQSRLMPGGVPQERFFGLPSFAARYGQRAFVERVLASAEPLRTGIEDLEL
jgi:bacillithiol biosynthesis cysteine-adding enzyme BshC